MQNAFRQDTNSSKAIENDDWIVDFKIGPMMKEAAQKQFKESDKVQQVFSFQWDDKSAFIPKKNHKWGSNQL